jgi:hypothetical protein
MTKGIAIDMEEFTKENLIERKDYAKAHQM